MAAAAGEGGGPDMINKHNITQQREGAEGEDEGTERTKMVEIRQLMLRGSSRTLPGQGENLT